MKTLLTTTAVAVTLTTAPVHAENFDNFQGFITANVGDFQFTVENTQTNGLTDLRAGYTFLNYDMNANTSGDLSAYAEYNRPRNELTLGTKYKMTYVPNQWFVYGSAQLEYTAPLDTFGSGDFYTTPAVGAGYVFNEDFAAWGEVNYTWNMSNDFARSGGELEVGVSVRLADNVALQPSLVRTFDTPRNETQARIGLELTF